MANYTDDRTLWNDLEHEFAGYMTARHREAHDVEVEEDLLEAYYEWILEYGRSLEQENYVKLVGVYAPELLQMVEV